MNNVYSQDEFYRIVTTHINRIKNLQQIEIAELKNNYTILLQKYQNLLAKNQKLV